MFIIRRLVTTIVLLVAVFLGASVLLENIAESQLATGAARTLHLTARPTVQIDAFPILYRVIQGRIPRIDVEARDFTVQGLDVAQLSVDMRGVHTNLDVLIRSDRFDLRVDRGQAAARITEDSINEFLSDQGARVRTTLRADGTVFVRADRSVAGRSHRFEATGRLALSGRTLSFKPSRVLVDGEPPPRALAARARRETTFSVEIPKLPGKIVPSTVAVATGELNLVADLSGYTLQLD
jgi:LmeA-like phospholipid-binding